MLKKLFTIGLAIGTLALSQVSHGYALVANLSGTHGQTVSSFFGSSSYNGYSGQVNLTFSGGAGTPTGYPTTFVGYCVDLEHGFNNGQDVLVKSMSQLTRNGISPNSGARGAWLYNKFSNTITSNVQGAALQVAIWEAIYDTDNNLSSGYYRIDGSQTSVLNQANSYLSALQSGFTPYSEATWFDAHGLGQDIIGPGAVPEPGLVSLFAGTSLSGLVLLRRKRAIK